MPAKTIYVRDEDIWNEAKELAGGEGLSGVIAQALADFVARRKAEQHGWKGYRISVDLENIDVPWRDGGPRHQDRIAFEGRHLLHRRFSIDAPIDDYNAEAVDVDVYRTRAGRLVLTADTSGDIGENLVYEPAVTHWAAYGTLKDLASDGLLERLQPADTAELMDEVARQLGEDWATWID